LAATSAALGGNLEAGELLPDGLLQARQTRRRKRGSTAQGKEFSHDGKSKKGDTSRRLIITRSPLEAGGGPPRRPATPIPLANATGPMKPSSYCQFAAITGARLS
jgi:hypothetical protein